MPAKNYYPIDDRTSIEVTPEMLDAGRLAYGVLFTSVLTDDVVLKIYLAMRKIYMQQHPGSA